MKYQPRNIQHALFLQLVRLQDKHNQKGYSLVVTVAMLLILSTLLISAAVVSKVNSASTSASAKSSGGFFAAEAGLNIRAQEIRQTFENSNRPTGVPPANLMACGDEDSTNNGSGDFACDSVIFQGQNVLTFVEEDSNNPTPIIVPAGEKFEGLSAQEYRYDLMSVAQTSENLPSAILGMSFKSRVVPLFQFAVFYENDADFTIPPNMTLNGRVHSNSDLYLNVASEDYTLRINGQVTTGGTLYRGDKASKGSQQCRGTVTIPNQSGTDQNLLCNNNNITPYLNDTTSPSDISTWGSKIKTQIEPLEVPPPEAFDPQPGSAYWDAADLRVVLTLDGSNNPTGIEIRNQNNSVDTAATARLMNSCPVTETTDIDDKWWVSGTPDFYTAHDRWIGVHSTDGFAEYDVVTVGSDIDSNVVDSVYNNGSGQRALLLRRRLGHKYQDTGNSATIATGNPVEGDTGNEKIRKAVVSTSNTFFNNREKHNATGGNAGNYIRMLDVNVQALIDCAHDQDLMTFADSTLNKPIDDDTDGGLVWFFTVEGPESNKNFSDDPDVDSDNTSKVGSRYGVRLYNGSSLNPTIAGAPNIQGLTVISDQAVYVRGNYNLSNGATNPANDTWKPAAIMADTINVLSEGWEMDDSENQTSYAYVENDLQPSPDDFGNRNPLETTVNAAFLSGSEITGGDNGAANQLNAIESGGVNNYPRFHEDWRGAINFNYRGSLVSLNEPRRINSDFCGSYDSANCNIYSPPVRNWDYDTRFNDAAYLPPLTPRAVYLRQELFQRDFDRTSSKTTNWFASMPTIPSIQPNFSL